MVRKYIGKRPEWPKYSPQLTANPTTKEHGPMKDDTITYCPGRGHNNFIAIFGRNGGPNLDELKARSSAYYGYSSECWEQLLTTCLFMFAGIRFFQQL